MNLLMVLGFLVFCNGQLVSSLSTEISVLSFTGYNISLDDYLSAYYLERGYYYMYYVIVRIGTPAKLFTLLLDTGSPITWVEHKNCATCINASLTGYSEKDSSTSRFIYCDGYKTCSMLKEDKCVNHFCEYEIEYITGKTKGMYYSDNLFLDAEEDRTDVFHNFIFGGSIEVNADVGKNKHGIFGLSNGRGSFISQNGFKRISFCLQHRLRDHDARTKLLLGDEAQMIGSSTRMLTVTDGSYVVRLTGISINGKLLGIQQWMLRVYHGQGAAILDTGSTRSSLPDMAYNIVVDKLKEIIDLPVDSKVDRGKFCFKITQDTNIYSFIPSMVLHFEGLDLQIPQRNLFTKIMDDEDYFMCLNIGQGFNIIIIGVPFLQDVNIGIDLNENKIFMQPTLCSFIGM